MAKIKLSTVAFMATVAFMMCYQVSNSKKVFPPYGNNGDPNSIPGNITCAQCHSGGSLQSASGQVLITFKDLNAADSTVIDSFKYKPGTVYSVTLKPTFTASNYGFQLSALNTSNQNAGTLAVVNSTTTWLGTGNVSKYISHHNANTNNVWNFKWTAPASNIGNVTFYYTVVQGDNSDSDEGDLVYKGANTITADTSTVNGVATVPVEHLALYPNPASNLVNISFTGNVAERVVVTLYSLNGQLQQQLLNETNNSGNFNRTLPLHNVPAGIYLLNVKAGANESTTKLLVE